MFTAVRTALGCMRCITLDWSKKNRTHFWHEQALSDIYSLWHKNYLFSTFLALLTSAFAFSLWKYGNHLFTKTSHYCFACWLQEVIAWFLWSHQLTTWAGFSWWGPGARAPLPPPLNPALLTTYTQAAVRVPKSYQLFFWDTEHKLNEHGIQKQIIRYINSPGFT